VLRCGSAFVWFNNVKKFDLDKAVIIALGSNLGAPDEALAAALIHLQSAGLTVLSRSRWWRSAAWPDASQPPYLNGVVILETGRQAQEVMSILLTIETAFGRQRALPNAPRILDLDLIAYGRDILAEPGLTLPHPRAYERRFVMGPLAEIAPDWLHPVLGQTAEALVEVATVGRDAEPI